MTTGMSKKLDEIWAKLDSFWNYLVERTQKQEPENLAMLVHATASVAELRRLFNELRQDSDSIVPLASDRSAESQKPYYVIRWKTPTDPKTFTYFSGYLPVLRVDAEPYVSVCFAAHADADDVAQFASHQEALKAYFDLPEFLARLDPKIIKMRKVNGRACEVDGHTREVPQQPTAPVNEEKASEEATDNTPQKSGYVFRTVSDTSCTLYYVEDFDWRPDFDEAFVFASQAEAEQVIGRVPLPNSYCLPQMLEVRLGTNATYKLHNLVSSFVPKMKYVMVATCTYAKFPRGSLYLRLQENNSYAWFADKEKATVFLNRLSLIEAVKNADVSLPVGFHNMSVRSVDS